VTNLDVGAGELDDVSNVAALRADDGADRRVRNVDERRFLQMKKCLFSKTTQPIRP
jgi:hypothetical protein